MTPAEVALDQFLRRRAWLAKEGRPEAEQEAKLRPWAVIALRAGANIGAMPGDVQLAYEDYRKGNLTDSAARACVADDICSRTEAMSVLAIARDKAIDKVTDRPAADAAKAAREFQEAQNLQVLAAYLGAPAYRCPSLNEFREAA